MGLVKLASYRPLTSKERKFLLKEEDKTINKLAPIAGGIGSALGVYGVAELSGLSPRDSKKLALATGLGGLGGLFVGRILKKRSLKNNPDKKYLVYEKGLKQMMSKK